MTLVCYQPPATDGWQGRVDGQEPGLLRWHQVIQPVNLERRPLPALASGQKGIAFLGFASDEGVRRNKGRTGAVEGPVALRKACSNFPVHFSGHVLADAGTIACEGHQLEMAQDALAATVNHILEAGYMPVLFGGGHEITYGHEKGIRQFFGEQAQTGIINFDAHFDLREPDEHGASSGTGFWQIAQDRQAAKMPFHYLALGIQQHSNTPKLFETAEQFGADHLPASLFQQKYHDQLIGAIQAFIQRTDHIYLTTCLDVFAAPHAPGVSATAYNGLVPDALFLDCFRTVLRSGKLAGTDIAELNPSLDQDQRTAKLAASLVFEIVMNYFTR
ncbi:formimidoylglutamase [Chitinophaga sp. GCM10012297]|uniref:Formimidoylglutamase n=1 Tax=Chitinophaga chungangae TaxID=2821488 RepID=A0ABS3YL53_9BACT|nr:formimidoylglutamase [Chitinophaga chungangae]MBO9155392.1 formimidoylglutamase [Chitinophaga chungangae]